MVTVHGVARAVDIYFLLLPLAHNMSPFKKVVKVLQVPTQPGLTTAELMLTNSDLQPGGLFLYPLRQSLHALAASVL